MSSCEKCWSDAYRPSLPGRQPERYAKLVKERDCTPEEQAGPAAGTCPACGRQTLHQYTDEPMCGCEVHGDE